MRFTDRKIRIAVAVLAGGLASVCAAQVPPPPQPTPTATLTGDGSTIELAVPLFKSRVVSVAGPANRISVGSPDIADIVVISPSQLYVLGKDVGTTNVLLWDSGNRLIGTISVVVQHDLEDL